MISDDSVLRQHRLAPMMSYIVPSNFGCCKVYTIHMPRYVEYCGFMFCFWKCWSLCPSGFQQSYIPIPHTINVICTKQVLVILSEYFTIIKTSLCEGKKECRMDTFPHCINCGENKGGGILLPPALIFTKSI